MEYRLNKIIVYTVLTVAAIVMLIPFLWMVITSLKTLPDTWMVPPTFIPKKFNFQNYLEAFNSAKFPRYFLNSIIVTVVNTFFQIITSTLAGYAFAKLNFKGKNVLFLLFLGTMMIPMEVTLIPNFFIMKGLHWHDTYFALTVPWAASVFSIFLMRQFFKSLPNELFESASIDGCTHWQILWKIIFPLSKPVFITVALFSIIGSWNAFLWPLIMTNSDAMRTIPVALKSFTSEYAMRYNLLMAAATFTTIPIIILYLFAQKYFVEGIATTGMK